ncbi:MAG TPA: hypothetical protein VGE52_19750 [Pirellulales bacterium]
MTNWLYWAGIHLAVALAIAAPLSFMHLMHALFGAWFAPRPDRSTERAFFPW